MPDEESRALVAETRVWLEQSGSMICRHGFDGVIRYVSANCRAILGYEPEELVGRKFADLLMPDAKEMLVRMHGRQPKADTRATARFRMKKKDGTPVWVETTGIVLPGSGDGESQVLSISRDVSDQQRIEEELGRQSALLTAVIENVPVMISVFDSAGRLRYVNPTVTKVLGWTVEDFLLSDPISVCYPDEDDRRFVSAFLENPPLGFVDLRPVARDGRYVDTTWTGVRLADGSIVSIGIDISGRKAAEEALRRSEAHARALNAELTAADLRKDEFLAVLAHELRNPLAPIANAVEAMARLGHLEPDLEQARRLISEKTRHLVRLVDDLTDVARIRHGKIQIRKQAISMADVLSQAVSTSRPLIESQGLRLVVSDSTPRAWVKGDVVRLVQVFSNLLNNAASFTPAGGEVRIESEVENGVAVVRVSDTGKGMRPEDLTKIFELFFHSPESPRAMGIGLGLARAIVELHDGSITAQSEGPDRGSRITVRLPLTEAPEEAVTPPPRRTSVPARRVLVVDDDTAVADGFALLLRSLGHDVRIATTGEEALSTAVEFAPDVAFVDLGMPGMSGYEVAVALRAQRSAPELRLVALSGYGIETVESRVRAAGFDAYMSKPTDPEEVQRFLS